jgi:hypothetical protein
MNSICISVCKARFYYDTKLHVGCGNSQARMRNHAYASSYGIFI